MDGGGRVAEQETGHGVTAGALAGIGERGGEVEAAVALVRLIDGELTAAEIGAPFNVCLPVVMLMLSTYWKVFSRRKIGRERV